MQTGPVGIAAPVTLLPGTARFLPLDGVTIRTGPDAATAVPACRPGRFAPDPGMANNDDVPAPDKTVFVHVGCRKTGTSHLQFGLKRAPKRVLGAGLAQPLGDRGGIMRRLLLPLQAAADGDVEAADRAVAALARTIRESAQPRHLITLEALAELPAAATAPLIRGLAEFDTRLIVTARSWAHTIPSEWQQRIKARYTGEYLEYAGAIRAPDDVGPGLAAESEAFRRRQDIADVVRRWRAGDPELPVSVILVPPLGAEGTTLVDAFCDLISVPPSALAIPQKITNESLSHPDAELVRRINLALGDRLPDTKGDYRYHVRRWIVAGSMMHRPRAKIRLPRDLEAWCRDESARQLAELQELGVDVIGDPEHYVSPTLPGDDFVPARDDEVVAAAAAVLADLAERRDEETRAWKDAVEEAERARRRAAAQRRSQSTAAAGPARRARTLAGRIRRRLSR